MTSPSKRPRVQHPTRFAPPVLALAVTLSLASAALSQVAITRPVIGPAERLKLLRSGTLETWQDTTRLGQEVYSVWQTPGLDSVVAISTVRYRLAGHGQVRHYEKWSFGVWRALDAYPLLYQYVEQVGERSRAARVVTHDTTAVLYHESGGAGEGNAIRMPPGRVYVLDPSVYELVERLVADFHASGLETRSQNALMVPKDTVVQVKLTRGPRETLDLPQRGKTPATRIDIFDDLTLIQTWVDDQGALVQIVAPAQRLRVVRVPPGEEEKAAIAVQRSDGASQAAPRDAEDQSASEPHRH